MGIDLVCNNKSYRCGYSRWNTIREEIANASIRYLRKIYDELFYSNTDYTANYRLVLEKIFEYIETNNCGTVIDFCELLMSDLEFQNAFIYFKVGGVYPLLNKQDIDGYYTAGNSLDIIETINIIEQYIELDDVKQSIPSIKNVFYESVSTQIVVSIM
jgi:hypothetical protein